jgi:hypothetical protein
MADQIIKNRQSEERLQYHDVYADSLKAINGLYATSLGSDSNQVKNAKEIEVRNLIAARIIAAKKQGDVSIKAIAKEAENLKDADQYIRYATMIDAMADAKLIPVELRRFSVDRDMPANIQARVEKK